MRIIRGRNKGKILSAPKNLPVRPTTDMAKEGIFNIIEEVKFVRNLNKIEADVEPSTS